MAKCPKCQSELIQVGKFYICPDHGQINPEEQADVFRSELLDKVKECSTSPFEFIQRNNEYLLQKMQNNEAVSALWQLRDSLEFQIRFLSFVTICQLFKTEGLDELKYNVKAVLSKVTGISFGDWVGIIIDIERAMCGKWLITGFERFFSDGEVTLLYKYLNGQPESIVNWRNRVFGHGVLKKDENWYAEELKNKIQLYFELCQNYNNCFTENSIIFKNIETINNPADLSFGVINDNSQNITMKGLKEDLQVFVFQDLIDANQKESTYFFFDKRKKSSVREGDRLVYLDFTDGLFQVKDFTEWRYHFSPTSTDLWKRNSFDADLYENLSNGMISDFECEYIAFENDTEIIIKWILDENDKLILLRGVAGSGKSFLLEGIARKLCAIGIPSVIYRIRSNMFTDYRTFIIELSHLLRKKLGSWTQEIQTKNMYYEDIRQQFIEFINEVMYSNKLNHLVIVIDGIDEIDHPMKNLLNVLPEDIKFPNGLTIILSERNHANSIVKSQVNRICHNYKLYHLDTEAEHYKNIVLTYIKKKTGFSDDIAMSILKKSDNNFSHVYHYCCAIMDGMLDKNNLIEYDKFYTNYMNNLQNTIGKDLFQRFFIYVLLVLCSMRDKVSIDMLVQMGISEHKLWSILDIFKGFIDVDISEGGKEYFFLSNQEIREFLKREDSYAERLKNLEIMFLKMASKAYHDWLVIDYEDEFDRYCLLYLIDYEGADHKLFDCDYVQTVLGYLERYALTEIRNSIKLFHNLEKVDPDYINEKDRAFIHFYQIKNHMAIGEYRNAINMADQYEQEMLQHCDGNILMELYSIIGNLQDVLGERKQAVLTYEKLMKLAESLNSDFYSQKAYRGLLWNLHFNDAEKAEEILKEVEKKYADKNSMIISLTLIKARIYQSVGRLDDAFSLYQDYIKNMQDDDDIVSLNENRLLLVEILAVCFDKYEYQKAISIGEQFLKNFNKISWLFECYCRSWLSLNYYMAGEEMKAKEHLSKAIEINRKDDLSEWMTMHLYSIQGMYLNEENDKHSALQLIEQVINLAVKCDDTWVYCDAIYDKLNILMDIDLNKVGLADMNKLLEKGVNAHLLHVNAKVDMLMAKWNAGSDIQKAKEYIDNAVALFNEKQGLPSVNELDMLYMQWCIYQKGGYDNSPIKTNIKNLIHTIVKKGNRNFISRDKITRIKKEVENTNGTI